MGHWSKFLANVGVFLAPLCVHADSLTYTKDTAKKYFDGIKNVYVAARISGQLSYIDAEQSILGTYGYEDAVTFYDVRSAGRSSSDQFVLIKVLKSSVARKVGDVISLKESTSYAPNTELGDAYLLFINEDHGELIFEACAYFPIDMLSPDLLSAPVPEIVNFIINSKASHCLMEETIIRVLN